MMDIQAWDVFTAGLWERYVAPFDGALDRIQWGEAWLYRLVTDAGATVATFEAPLCVNGMKVS